MQSNFSAGSDCMRFPQITDGHLPAPSGNLTEASFVRVSVDFLKPRDVSLIPVPNNMNKK